MRLDYTVIEEKGSIALIRRGETNSEYAVVEGLVAKENRMYNGTDWSSTIGYWNCSIQGLLFPVIAWYDIIGNEKSP